MQIKLKSLTLNNFKGIRSMTVDFSEATSVYGDNATGKTTLFDAFCWLLFGKDSQDRKDFQVKTLDTENRAINKLEHSVKGVLYKDGIEITLQRIFKEKWVKKRGETLSEFSGHETAFFIDEAPVQLGHYQEFISAMIPESLFKMLTSPYYFTSLKWQEQRTALFKMAGEISDNAIAGDVPEFVALLSKGKVLDQYKKELSGKRKLLNETLKLIPSRIDEIHRGLPDHTDWPDIAARIGKIEGEIQNIEDQIASQNKAYSQANRDLTDKMNSIHKLKRELTDIEFSERNKLTEANRKYTSDLEAAQDALTKINGRERDLQPDIANQKTRLANLETEKADLVKKWEARNSETLSFDKVNFSCPTCAQELPTANVAKKKDELTRSFNEKKAADLKAIESEGTQLKRAVESTQGSLDQASKSLASLLQDAEKKALAIKDFLESPAPTETASLDKILASSARYQNIHSEITLLEAGIDKPVEPDFDEMAERKRELSSERDQLKNKITLQQQREKSLFRIEELEKEEISLSQQIADLEKEEYVIDRFTKLKIETIENRINCMFRIVKFKMYEQLINGGEEETCIALVGGVPISDANHAGRINAGLDIVSAISSHYAVNAPVFIDNAEAITKLIAIDSQLIRLVVSEPDKKLRITHTQEKVAA